jgi:hypothetical protein
MRAVQASLKALKACVMRHVRTTFPPAIANYLPV